jgi:hypothetical protein
MAYKCNYVKRKNGNKCPRAVFPVAFKHNIKVNADWFSGWLIKHIGCCRHRRRCEMSDKDFTLKCTPKRRERKIMAVFQRGTSAGTNQTIVNVPRRSAQIEASRRLRRKRNRPVAKPAKKMPREGK